MTLPPSMVEEVVQKVKTPLPCADVVRKTFNYDPETGVLTWANLTGRRVPSGSEAGTLKPNGYRYVKTRGAGYPVHRLIWLMMTGDDPGALEIDHINGKRDDNRWANLRLATLSQNRANSQKQRNNLTGFKGVSRATGRSKNCWVASINTGKRNIYLGCFKSPEAAHDAYVVAATAIHGEFACSGKRED